MLYNNNLPVNVEQFIIKSQRKNHIKNISLRHYSEYISFLLCYHQIQQGKFLCLLFRDIETKKLTLLYSAMLVNIFLIKRSVEFKSISTESDQPGPLKIREISPNNSYR